MYTPDREVNPPDEKEIESKEEKCADCGCENSDMRYRFENSKLKLVPICPICQQERVVNDLQIKLKYAENELEKLKQK